MKLKTLVKLNEVREHPSKIMLHDCNNNEVCYLNVTASLRVNRIDVIKHLRIIEDKKRKSKADKQLIEISKMYKNRLYELEARIQNLITEVK